MTDLSYSQNMEDVHIWQAFGGRSDGFYIDIGAGHPIADNVTFWLYERGWQGICVEPQPALAALYQYVRPRDVVLDLVVGRASGEIDFHIVDRLHGLSTTVERHAQGAGQHGAGYRTVRMPVVTLADLCEGRGVSEIDLLKIDVEGGEPDVLAGNDWQRFRPKMIVAEAIVPGSDAPGWEAWEPHLLAHGYTFTLFDTLNRFYVANEQTELLERAPRGRADWAAVRHMYEIGRAPENARHPDHALARELEKGFLASLPMIDKGVLATVLAKARGLEDSAEVERLADWLDSEEARATLGRIACGYDGGQIHDD